MVRLGEGLQPDVRAILEAGHAVVAQGGRTPDQMSPVEARAGYRAGRFAAMPAPEEMETVRDFSTPGPHGPVRMRLYRPPGHGRAALPGVVYFHGGGWVMGDLDTHDSLCRSLAIYARASVVAVDYRLAPEHKFPVPVEDAWAALNHVAATGSELGIDPGRLAVAGDSAGGNLATVCALLARDAGGVGPDKVALRYQALIYPVTDLASRTASKEEFAEGHSLTRPLMGWYEGHYIRSDADRLDWRGSPLRAESLRGLPPALVMTASHDPLRDEGEDYAARLARESGQPVTLWRVPGQIHGFLPMGKVVAGAGPAVEWVGRLVGEAIA